MSEENIAFVRGVYDAFGRGDVDAVLGAFAEDIDWQEAEGMPYEAQRGPQAVAENIFGPVTTDIEGFSAAPEEFYAGGDEVVAIGRYTGTAAESGKPLDIPFVHAWTVRDGKIHRFRQYTDTAVFNATIAVEATA